ncbi:uncharacterized protein LOC101755655 [Setaria italica]|uniref:uncharacterized protein LOC101755655 n=1 Tax=Setaria italica TaxID=4555 RepID=UPI000350F816|nr:uncharacterized protein LOC101755655 [Setaria italica]
MTKVVDSCPPVPEDAERWQQNRLLTEKQKRRKDKEMARKKKKATKELHWRRWGKVVAAPWDFVLPLASKKVLRVSTTSAGRAATLPAVSGGVAGETVEPTAKAAPPAATGGRVPQPGTGQGPTPAPPFASAVDPAGQGVAPKVPPASEVIDLDDEAEGEPVGEALAAEGAPMVTAEMVAEEMGAVALVAATEMAATEEEGTSPSPPAATGTTAVVEAGTPAPAAATKAAAAAGMGTPAPAAATKMVAAAERAGRASASTTAVGTPTEIAAHAPGSSTRPAASGVVAPSPTAASGTVVPGLTRAASTLVPVNPVPKAWGWRSREDPKRPLFVLDDAKEWGKWQAVQDGLANVRAALSSAMGELDGVGVPGGQAATEKDLHDAEELARLKGDYEALQKTVECIQRERQKAWQERDSEAIQKAEAEKIVAELEAEVSQLHVLLWTDLTDELARLREILDVERAKHDNLRDAVRVVCDGLGVVEGEGTSSLAARVLGAYRRAREIAQEALHVGVRRVFGVFGSHYSGINFDGMSGGYASSYS